MAKFKKKIFFNSSLPRSGSTLFSNIIGQDKRFYVTPTSGLASLLLVSQNIFLSRDEFKAQDKNIMKEALKGFCSEALQGYFKNITDKNFILDDSRDWGVHYSFIDFFYPNPKIVSLIRNPIDIFCSMEKLFKKACLKNSKIQINSEFKNTSLEQRIEYWSNTIPIGLAFNRLQEIIKFNYSKNFLFIKYEDLCINKQIEIDKFYKFIDMKTNNVDFNNIKQVTKENDNIYGVFGEHKIRSQVKVNDSMAKQILGQKIIEHIQDKYAWFYEFFNYEIQFF